MRPTIDELTRVLGREPHPEGGFYRETYRAADMVETPRGRRSACTAILFLVTGDSVSRLHRLASDELWVFQGGLPLELVTLSSDGVLLRHTLGDPAEAAGERQIADSPGELVPQSLVPAGLWQGARVVENAEEAPERAWSLVSCVVTPGFDFSDFELGGREALLAALPQHRELVLAFT
jgi:hypothetical protein